MADIFQLMPQPFFIAQYPQLQSLDRRKTPDGALGGKNMCYSIRHILPVPESL